MTAPLLELVGVGREYPSGESSFSALRDLDLTIEAGEMVAIIGASGSGKSTLMNILGCLDRPTSGRYLIAGQDTAELDADELAGLRSERMGFIFQRYNLLAELTALENVELPAVYAGVERRVRRERAAELLKYLNLEHRVHHRSAQLSGGEQQRVSIARALMNSGEIILADEPTGALDSASGKEVLSILRALNAKGHTVIIVTHDPRVARQAARLIRLSDGLLLSDERRATEMRAVKPAQAAFLLAPRQEFRTAQRAFPEAFRMALRAMAAHRLRTVLTMLGIIIGIASVASVVALGRGGREHMLATFRVMGTNTVDVYPGENWGDERAASIQTLVPSDAEAIAQQGHVDSVSPTVTKSLIARYGNVSVSASINGVGDNYFRVHGIGFSAGSGFSASDIGLLGQVVVIDANARAALFSSGADPIGRILILGNAPFRIIGVTRRFQAMGFVARGINVWAPYTSVLVRILGQRHLNSISARVSDNAPSDIVVDVITRLLVRRHGRKDFYIFNTDTVRKAIEETTSTMTLVVGTIAVISLIVGGIGVMNIMLVSVSERAREIGIHAAIGARGADIMRQFLIESMLICLSGGALGLAASAIAALICSTILPTFPMVFSATSIAAALIVSTAVGVSFGLLPARRAANMNPIDALARE